MTDKKQQEPKSKERILQAAISLFSHKGYAETGLRELAAAAGVNLSMINYFFGSKKELLKKILDTFLSGYLAIAEKQLAGTDDLHSRLERFITSTTSYFDAERDSLIITISELPHDDPEIVEHKASWAKQMVEIIDRELCQEDVTGSDHQIPPTCLAPMLTSLIASRFLLGPLMEKVQQDGFKTVPIEDYAEMLATILLQGISGSRGGSEKKSQKSGSTNI
ncbi:MAG: TetR/AcrR family transcriptional regulator [Deltaproteobacteria bacterium]|nr:TetR/AcrR family transcriptional regulator [Deltaproteobacteria bacterium]